MKRTSVYLLRNNLASYLNEVAKSGETIVIEKYKKPIAMIVPPKKKIIKDDFRRFFGFLRRKGDNETGIEYENRIRRNAKERKYMRNLRKGIT